MKAILEVAVPLGFWIVVLAALIATDFTIAEKVLIASAVVFPGVILQAIVDLQRKQLLWIRLAFISTETLRLDRSNKTPAWNILRSDLRMETEQHQAEKEFDRITGADLLKPIAVILLCVVVAFLALVVADTWLG